MLWLGLDLVWADLLGLGARLCVLVYRCWWRCLPFGWFSGFGCDVAVGVGCTFVAAVRFCCLCVGGFAFSGACGFRVLGV